MPQEFDKFKTNPEKATSRVAINGVMLASLFVVLTVIFLEPETFDILVVAQMMLAIPFLFVSSLAYAKIGYWKQIRLWDIFGYFTNTLGNMLVVNATGLMVSKISIFVSFTYFVITITLLLIYSIINIVYIKETYQVKILKFLFSTLILFLGGILPLFIGHEFFN